MRQSQTDLDSSATGQLHCLISRFDLCKAKAEKWRMLFSSINMPGVTETCSEVAQKIFGRPRICEWMGFASSSKPGRKVHYRNSTLHTTIALDSYSCMTPLSCITVSCACGPSVSMKVPGHCFRRGITEFCATVGAWEKLVPEISGEDVLGKGQIGFFSRKRRGAGPWHFQSSVECCKFSSIPFEFLGLNLSVKFSYRYCFCSTSTQYYK